MQDNPEFDEEKASKMKETGNKYFRDQNFTKASYWYSSALMFEVSRDLRATIHCNRALAFLKLGNYHYALYDCKRCLRHNNKNVKALLISGTCLNRVGKPRKARRRLSRANILKPGVPDVERELVFSESLLTKKKEAKEARAKEARTRKPPLTDDGTEEEEDPKTSYSKVACPPEVQRFVEKLRKEDSVRSISSRVSKYIGIQRIEFKGEIHKMFNKHILKKFLELWDHKERCLRIQAGLCMFVEYFAYDTVLVKKLLFSAKFAERLHPFLEECIDCDFEQGILAALNVLKGFSRNGGFELREACLYSLDVMLQLILMNKGFKNEYERKIVGRILHVFGHTNDFLVETLPRRFSRERLLKLVARFCSGNYFDESTVHHSLQCLIGAIRKPADLKNDLYLRKVVLGYLRNPSFKTRSMVFERLTYVFESTEHGSSPMSGRETFGLDEATFDRIRLLPENIQKVLTDKSCFLKHIQVTKASIAILKESMKEFASTSTDVDALYIKFGGRIIKEIIFRMDTFPQWSLGRDDGVLFEDDDGKNADLPFKNLVEFTHKSIAAMRRKKLFRESGILQCKLLIVTGNWENCSKLGRKFLTKFPDEVYFHYAVVMDSLVKLDYNSPGFSMAHRYAVRALELCGKQGIEDGYIVNAFLMYLCQYYYKCVGVKNPNNSNEMLKSYKICERYVEKYLKVVTVDENNSYMVVFIKLFLDIVVNYEEFDYFKFKDTVDDLFNVRLKVMKVLRNVHNIPPALPFFKFLDENISALFEYEKSFKEWKFTGNTGCSDPEPPTCVNCGAAGEKLMMCSRCKRVRYCGRNCQMEHWKKHKVVCKKL